MSESGDIPITVVMRSYNDAPILPRTLESLDSQEGVDVTLFVYESASTDGSQEIFEEHGYDYIYHLEPGEYRSSKVLNDGAERSENELVAYVNSDAIMTEALSLRRLADAILTEEKVCGAFARQTVRPDADPMTRVDYHVAFDNPPPPRGASRQLDEPRLQHGAPQRPDGAEVRRDPNICRRR